MRRFIPFVLLLVSLASFGENVITDAQGVKYTVNSDGTTCNVSGYTDACSGAIVIPSTIEGKTVVAVNDYALAYSTQITSIVLPNSVRIIGEGAFMDDGTRSSKLESVTLPEGLEVIEDFAFEHCISLTACNIPSTVEFIRQNAFFDVSMSNVTLPRSLKCLENQAFYIDGNVTFTCESPTPPSIDPQSFTDGLGFKGNYSLIVPKGCRDVYYNQSGWNSQFGSISESNTSVDPFPEPYTDAQGVEYTLIGSGDYQGTYFVSGHTNACSGAVTIPSTINGKTVSYVGHGAFKSLSGLTSVTIESGINSIRSNAFAGCTNLSSVVLPNSLKQIGNNSFANCSKLASVIIPSSVVRVDAHAFGSCEKLTSAILECNVSSLWTQVFNGCQDANFYLTTLTVSAVTPEVVVRDVFYYLGSSKKSSVTLIVPVGSISAYKAADFWKDFKSIQNTEGNTEDVLANADGVEIDGIYYNLKSSGETKTAEVTKNPNKYSGTVEIPANITYKAVDYKVTSVGEDAFNSCSNLTSVTIPNGVTSIGPGAFLWDDNLISVSIPSSVSTIGEGAFAFCNSLKEITLPDGLTAIEGGTFLLCSSLRKVTIPSTVTRIGAKLDDEQNDGPFNGTSLETLVVPASVQTIGQYGLWATPNTIIIMESATPPSTIHDMALEDALGSLVFSKIIVPNGSKDAYQNANVWKKYKDLIFEQGESSVRILKGVSAGTLPTLISESEKYNIDHLVITGQLNGTDFRLLREMAGNDYQGNPTEGKLKNLDLSGVTIVDGGEKYLDAENVTINKSNPNYSPSIIHVSTIVQNYGEDIDFLTHNNDLSHFLFIGCVKLEELILPQNITSIGSYVFYYCRNLNTMKIPASVTSVKKYALWFCSGLTSLTIPKTLTSIGEGAFCGLTNATSITVEGDNPNYDSRENCNAIIETSTNKLIAGCKNTLIPNGVTSIENNALRNLDITSITIPNSVTNIGGYAFHYCSGLTSLTIPNSVTSIGSMAFYNCNGLTSIVVEDGNSVYDSRDNCNAIIKTETNTLVQGCNTSKIPASVTIIGSNAFSWCSGLTSVTIPSSVTSIGNNAFQYCNSLTTVAVQNPTPVVIKENTFSNRANATLYVPAGSKADYEAADYWKEFKEIVEIPASTGIKVAKGMTTYTSEYNLDFSSLGDDVKAYVATGYDYDKNTIWLTRVKDVPAGTPILVQAPASETPYDIPVKASSGCYYKNMLVGNLSEGDITLSATTGDMTNYYLSNGKFLTATGSNTIGNGKAYLQIPTTPPAATVGSSQAVKLNDYGFASFCGSQDLDFTDVEGLKAFAVTGYDDANGTIWLTRVKRVSARTPLLLKGGSGASYSVPSVAVGSYYANMMKGNLSGSTITIHTTDGDMTNYYLKGNQLLKATDGGNTIGNGKAYMQIPSKHVTRSMEDMIAGLLIYGISGDEPEVISIPVARGLDGDGTTNIREKLAPEQTNDVYYNLQGQRVDKPKKGLYIKNGKKVVIK